MLPSILARQVERGLEEFLRGAFSPSTPGFDDIIDRFVAESENLFKGPYLSFDMPFRDGDAGRDYFPDVPLSFSPYKHQERAFARVGSGAPASTVIATGTGSGKTECFTWPILDYCLRTENEPGIKAILIYPMNALATDQARRLAAAIWKNDKLKGSVRVGLYVDVEPGSPSATMTEADVITSRDEIRRNPPDILITNYKMLDYMLVRPRDKALWAHNEPETLRYLVVDELHTFDGAQGTDLACLIRRLKARLECPKDHLCCVGTSATLGQDGTSRIISYASQVFGEPFDESAIVTEDRLTIAEYLLDKDVSEVHVPTPEQVASLIHDTDGLTPPELIARAYELWFTQGPETAIDDPQWRLDLAEKLDGHVFLQSLLRAIKGRPTAYADLLEQLKGKSYLASDDPEYLTGIIDTLTALVSHARRTKPDLIDKTGQPILLPYFSVRSQLWFRELKRIVGDLTVRPSLRYSDDLTEDALRKHLPVVHCKDCGGTGWAAISPLRGQRLEGEPKKVYEKYFGYSDRLRFVLLDKPERERQRERRFTHSARVCSDCLTYHDTAEQRAKCRSCASENLVDAYIHFPAVVRSENVHVTHDCPYCGSTDGMGILGAQSPTLLSATVSTMFASPHNDDPKLLTFSDSVQDAAHRAGFFEARSFASVFRTALRKFVSQTGQPVGLDSVLRDLPPFLRKEGDPEFVATFTPQDQQWRKDYEILLETGVLDDRSNLPSILEERLSWEAFAELSFRSQNGQTLEKAGLIGIHPEVTRVRDAARKMMVQARDKLGDGFETFTEDEWLAFLLGLIARMRQRGAVLTDLTRDFLDVGANWFALLRRSGREHKLPNMHPRAPRPVFPASRFAEGYDSVGSVGSATSWYAGWADKVFLEKHALAPASYPDLYFLAFDALEKARLVERRDMGPKFQTSVVWGLLPSEIKLWQDISALRCNRCGHAHHVPVDAENSWNGMPCTKLGCEGSMQTHDASARKAYFERIFGSARIRRVIAREHTGLLERDVRTRIEKGFMKAEQDPWDPNILSATSTLEMGIDIGDLSTLALCSVPPEQANYIQRIGRTGRRDGNSLNLTVATGRSHDLYFWAEPKEMIAGAIKTPGVHLKAFAILKRQFAAFTLDSWNRETTLGEGEGYGTLRTCFENIQLGHDKLFPLSWYRYAEDNVERLLSGFIGLFPELTAESRDTVDRLAAFARGEEGGFTAWVADEFQRIKDERDDLLRQIKRSDNETKRVRKLNPPPQDREDQLAALRLERRSLRELVKDIERKDVLGFLTEHGILPNYAFPEEGIHLKSVIYRRPQRGEDLETTVYEYARSASAGLSDFAPPSRFYAEGHQVRIDEVNLDLSEIETWRVCPDCTYMERLVGGETDKPCPSCASDSWRDSSQKRDFIRLRQVIAVTDARRARIGDDSDEREIRSFDRSLFPSFAKDAVEEAYSLADAPLPFGFEYIRQCNFREVNFGEPREGQGLFRAAGRDARGGGFQICHHCGKIQGIRRRRGEPNHKPRCPAKDSEDTDDFLKIAYLYREFPSEAIRILMPISALDADKGVQSFISGLNLGLRLHFEGKVDHLRMAMLEASEGLITRRYLYLYDSVPGGTGYLKQLMTKPEDFRAIFEKALQHMQGCSCNGDPDKDGCYRCIYAYRDASRMEKTSRSYAVSMFSAILEHWDSLESVGSIGDIKGNALLESELEAMFVARLEKMAKDAGGIFRTVTVNGKKGYFLKLGEDAQAWEVEPQVWMNERFILPVKTRADFLITPKPSSGSLKPIAIYVDGWENHYDRIASDIEKRLAIARTGDCLTWSLSYNDLDKEAASTPQQRVEHLWNPFEGHSFEGSLEKFFTSDGCAAARKCVTAPAPKVLEAYLRGETPKQWETVPQILTLVTLLAAASEKQPEKIRERVIADGGGQLADFLEELGPQSRMAMLARDGFAFLAGMPTPPDLEKSTPIVLLDDTQGNTAEAKQAWNTALRLLNLTQFSERAHVAAQSNHNMPLPHGATPGAAVDDGAWQEVYDLTAEELHPVIDALRSESVNLPIVGFELLDGSRVVGEAELAWEDQKIGIVFSEHESVFVKQGWKTFEYDSIIGDSSEFLKEIKNKMGAKV
ncbi:DEAD/DEAH box helicase [Ruegeria marina]|uniref:DEAD/DEAH box helicase domain-containing protein n=1 Tax=Ruegeria marina TaxID=639004 RepID=A0A1G7DBH9_9RHOB|nr:DEAD/DEAH box helicase [Ruegeria marina]SDE48276.1 DEAD/DEAH box helicase domain-containing protein [Ruegeria marina]